MYVQHQIVESNRPNFVKPDLFDIDKYSARSPYDFTLPVCVSDHHFNAAAYQNHTIQFLP